MSADQPFDDNSALVSKASNHVVMASTKVLTGIDLVAHSQMTKVRQPSFISASMTRLSRAWFAPILADQNSGLVLGSLK